MLTQEVEKGRVRLLYLCVCVCVERGGILQECSAHYWPDKILQPITWGKLTVELNVERNSGSYSYRDLSVTKVCACNVCESVSKVCACNVCVIMCASVCKHCVMLIVGAGW